MTAELFLRTCSNRLELFFKERNYVTLESLPKTADLYLRAQSHSSSYKLKTDDNIAFVAEKQCEVPKRLDTRAGISCFPCNKVGHMAADCFSDAYASRESGTCRICGKSGQ